MPSKSQTTRARRDWPSSSTRHRACSSSWMCVDGNGENPPITGCPSGGVMLLVAAPALSSAAEAEYAHETRQAMQTAIAVRIMIGSPFESDIMLMYRDPAL